MKNISTKNIVLKILFDLQVYIKYVEKCEKKH